MTGVGSLSADMCSGMRCLDPVHREPTKLVLDKRRHESLRDDEPSLTNRDSRLPTIGSIKSHFNK